MSLNEINKLIRMRRSVFPNMYTGEPIAREKIEQILENANWAPTHRKTEPWRFKVITGDAKQRLGNWLAEDYKQHVEPATFNEKKYFKPIKKATQSSVIIAICMQRDPSETVPEWEEIAATACAVQNMWLTCTAMDIGCYWSSPSAINRFEEFLPLADGERCLGLFYMGSWNPVEMPAVRRDIGEKVAWVK